MSREEKKEREKKPYILLEGYKFHFYLSKDHLFFNLSNSKHSSSCHAGTGINVFLSCLFPLVKMAFYKFMMVTLSSTMIHSLLVSTVKQQKCEHERYIIFTIRYRYTLTQNEMSACPLNLHLND